MDLKKQTVITMSVQRLIDRLEVTDDLRSSFTKGNIKIEVPYELIEQLDAIDIRIKTSFLNSVGLKEGGYVIVPEEGNYGKCAPIASQFLKIGAVNSLDFSCGSVDMKNALGETICLVASVKDVLKMATIKDVEETKQLTIECRENIVKGVEKCSKRAKAIDYDYREYSDSVEDSLGFIDRDLKKLDAILRDIKRQENT
jgi:hypothetical protein